MKKAMKVGLIALVLAVGILPSGASAVIFLCGDICVNWQSCTRQCIDDISGFQINCGQYGCCTQNQSNCNSLNAAATISPVCQAEPLSSSPATPLFAPIASP